jgi:hypothetical protein
MNAMIHRPFLAFLTYYKFEKKNSTMISYACRTLRTQKPSFLFSSFQTWLMHAFTYIPPPYSLNLFEASHHHHWPLQHLLLSLTDLHDHLNLSLVHFWNGIIWNQPCHAWCIVMQDSSHTSLSLSHHPCCGKIHELIICQLAQHWH